MRIKSALTIIMAVVLLPSFFCFGEPKKSSQKFAEYYRIQYEAEKEKLPKLVFQLFYAVKDSLDYGYIDGEDKQPQPKAHLKEYSRVTSDLIESFEKEYQIEKYERIGNEYVLVVSSKVNVIEKYKATRMEKFVFSNGKWKSLGGYLYF